MKYIVRPLMNPHCHLREGNVLAPLTALAIQGGARLLGPMPNTVAGLMTADQVVKYRADIYAGVPFDKVKNYVSVVGIIQMTDATATKDVDECINRGIIDAKVYPKARTTESGHGVSNYADIIDIVKYAGTRGMRIHFHPEHPSHLFDNRDAEFAFLPIVDILMHSTDATIIWEHGTDSRCIQHWEDWAKTGRFYVTLTAHHLLENETGAYGDVQAVCKPPYKKEQDRRALIELVVKDYPWVMAGGDDAPHPIGKKHVVGRCACGAYTAPFLFQLYAHALLKKVGLDIFENFTCLNARKLYLPASQIDTDDRLTLSEEPFIIPQRYEAGEWIIEPFWAGRTIDFTLDKGHTTE